MRNRLVFSKIKTMKRLIYIFLLALISCSNDDQINDPNTVSGVISVYATTPIEYVRYSQQDKEDTTKVYTINAPVVDGKCEVVSVFRKGFTTTIHTKLTSPGTINLVVKSNGNVIKEVSYKINGNYSLELYATF